MPTTRRAVLSTALGTMAVLATPSPSFAAPGPAVEIGMNRLTFEDTFSSISSIDRYRSGAGGYRWYARAPWGQPSFAAGDFAIVRDNSATFLRLTPSVNNINWGMSTMDPVTGNGRSFRFGYVEARMRFVTPPEPNWDSGRWAFAWPSIWGITDLHLQGRQGPRTVELDVFEACGGPGTHIGVVHDLFNGQKWSSSNATHNVGADFGQWHTYGARWNANGAAWYFDNRHLMTQTWGPNGPVPAARFNSQETTLPSPRDLFTGFGDANLVFALGSGVGAPMDVDWVRVWQS